MELGKKVKELELSDVDEAENEVEVTKELEVGWAKTVLAIKLCEGIRITYQPGAQVARSRNQLAGHREQ